jgi:hypothetical protein
MVVLPKENRTQLKEAATLDRKSGGAEGSAVSLHRQQHLLVEADLLPYHVFR